MHTAVCMKAFLESMVEHAEGLKNEGLDIKGNGWVAAFPAPNVSIKLQPGPEDNDLQTTESFEANADNSPHEFDFLGKAIDTGFRVAKNSASDRATISVQLAYILAEAQEHELFPRNLEYRGREPLKGVNDGIPYPNTVINTETCEKRKELRRKEDTLVGKTTPGDGHLKEFLTQFMSVAQIELPHFDDGKSPSGTSLKPNSYQDFVKAYEAAEREIKQRDLGIAASAEAPDGSEKLETAPDDLISPL